MRKLFMALGLTVIIVFSDFLPVPIMENSNAEEGIPSYAKWGRLAMKETKRKYPNAEIIDYLHVGRKTKGESTIEEFKLWLKGKNKEFGVFIKIEFNTQSEKVLGITFTETER